MARPDARCAALIELLHNDGALKRPPDDDAKIELCGALAKLMAGIAGSPFDFRAHQPEVDRPVPYLLPINRR